MNANILNSIAICILAITLIIHMLFSKHQASIELKSPPRVHWIATTLDMDDGRECVISGLVYDDAGGRTYPVVGPYTVCSNPNEPRYLNSNRDL